MMLQQHWGEFEEMKRWQSMLVDVVRRPTRISTSFPTSWERPPFRIHKVNCDGAWSKERGSFGWVVVKDSAGIFQGAGGLGNFPCNSSLMAEVEAIREALLACVEKGFFDTQLESDSKCFVGMIIGALQPEAMLEAGILYDIRRLKQPMMLVEFMFAFRNCNRIAYLMAFFVSKMDGLYGWDFFDP